MQISKKLQESSLLLLVFLFFKFDGQYEGWNKKQIELLKALLGFEAVDPLVRGPCNFGPKARGQSVFCPKSKGSFIIWSQKQEVIYIFVQKARGAIQFGPKRKRSIYILSQLQVVI